jgi:DNA-binding beta-propeller fold protein YncE
MKGISSIYIIFIALMFAAASAQAQDYRVITVYANDLCYSPFTDRLYLAVPGNRPDGNAVLGLNPVTGTVEQRIEVGSEPTKIAVSKDGKYLYISMFGTPFIRRCDLATGLVEDAAGLEQYIAQYQDYYPDFAKLIETIPGAPLSIIAVKGYDQFTVYDPTGPRPQEANQGSGTRDMAISDDGQTLWVFQDDQFNRPLKRYSVDAQGISYVNSYPGLIEYGAFELAYQQNRLYMGSGQIFDVSGGTPNLLTKINFGQDFGYPHAEMVPAPDNNDLFIFNTYDPDNLFSSTGYFLRTFDKNTFQEKSSLKVPANLFQTETDKMVAMGNGRVAVLGIDNYYYGPGRKLALFNLNGCQAANLNLSVTPAYAQACLGDTVVLQAAPGYNRYYWSNGSTEPSIKVTKTTVDSLFYRVDDINGCLSQPSSKAFVLMESLPEAPSLNTDLNTNILCPGATAHLSAYSNNYPAPLQYVFSTGDTLPYTQHPAISAPGLYTAYAISEAGCASPLSKIEIFPAMPPVDKPQISVSGNLNFCSANKLVLSAPYDAYGYLWSTGATTRTIEPFYDGHYSVQLQYKNGCTGPSSDTLQVHLYETPATLQIEESYFVLTIKAPSLIADSVQWYLNGAAIAGAHGATFTPSQSGLYTVRNFTFFCSSDYSLPYFFGKNCTVKIEANPYDVPAQEYTLSAFSAPANDYTWQWSNGSTQQYITVNQAAEYCVTATRPADGCTATACVKLKANNQAGAVVFANGVPLPDAEVKLLKTNGVLIETVGSMQTGADGRALFPQIAQGKYRLQGIPKPNTPISNGYFPTYCFSELFWDDAYELQVGDLWVESFPPTFYSIQLVPTMMLTGPGTVNGWVLSGPQFAVHMNSPELALNSIPVAGAVLILKNQFNTPVEYAITDATGAYNFSNLPYGTYYLYLEIAGIPSLYATITLDAGHLAAAGVVFTIIDGNVTVGHGQQPTQPHARIWPNPMTETLVVESVEAFHCSLINTLGETLEEWDHPAGAHAHKLGVRSMGLYQIKMETADGRIKVMKVVGGNR